MTPLKGKTGITLGNFFIKTSYKKNKADDSDILLELTIYKALYYT